MSFVPENDLERALLAASGDSSRYGDFLAALAGGELLIPQQEGGERTLEDVGEEVTFPLIEHDGRTYVPVFTSVEQFRLGAPGEMGFVRVPTEGLVEGWPEEHGMAINPGAGIGLALEAAAVRSLGSPSAPAMETLPAGAKVMLGEPAEEPDDLLDAVGAACRSEAGVMRAYRALMALEDATGEPQIVIGIELDAGHSAEEVFERVGAAAAPHSPGPFSFVVVDETNLSAVARFLLLETDPFYRRS